MRTTVFSAAVALACLAAHPARAQSIEYTDAISNKVLLLNVNPVDFTDAASRQALMLSVSSVEYTDATSRQALMLSVSPMEYTDAASRQALMLGVSNVEYTDAASRQVLLYLPPYIAALMDARNALAIAAGLQKSTSNNMNRLNIIRDGASASAVDIRDAVRLGRMAMGLDQ